MDVDSRKKFDAYFRNIVSGTDANHPKPKSCKISKVGHFCLIFLTFFIVADYYRYTSQNPLSCINFL